MDGICLIEWSIGDIKVTSVFEQVLPDMDLIIPEATKEDEVIRSRFWGDE
jgi:hypothetical protein